MLPIPHPSRSRSQPGPLVWYAASSCHDWRLAEVFRRVLCCLQEKGLFGSPDHLSVLSLSTGKERAFPSPFADADAMLRCVSKRMKSFVLQARGTAPRPWDLGLSVQPMLGSTGFVRGVNTVYLEFELPTPGDRDWSELLAEAFEQVHTGADTEFAFIHPKTGLDDLTDGAYDPPVTVGPLFRGVLWANLLGADLLDEFELKALRGLPAENLRHDPASRSLWFYGADSIAGATQDEDRLVALTQAVRAALRPESRFSG